MSLLGKTIVFDGTLTMKRTDLTKAAKTAGAKVGSSVTKNTSIFVAGPGVGAKEDDAKAKGVEIWSEDQFVAAIGSGDSPALKGGKQKAASSAEDQEDAPKAKKAKEAPAPPKAEHKAAPGCTMAADGSAAAPQYEIWRNPQKSIDSYGEPFSAWATYVPNMPAWFVVWNEGSPDEGPGRMNRWAPAKPPGFTERHVVTKEMLSLAHGATVIGEDDEEIDYHMALHGRNDSVSVVDLEPIAG